MTTRVLPHSALQQCSARPMRIMTMIKITKTTRNALRDTLSCSSPLLLICANVSDVPGAHWAPHFMHVLRTRFFRPAVTPTAVPAMSSPKSAAPSSRFVTDRSCTAREPHAMHATTSSDPCGSGSDGSAGAGLDSATGGWGTGWGPARDPWVSASPRTGRSLLIEPQRQRVSRRQRQRRTGHRGPASSLL
jgi:hypothetical protein